jgi:hypothetical protein
MQNLSFPECDGGRGGANQTTGVLGTIGHDQRVYRRQTGAQQKYTNWRHKKALKHGFVSSQRLPCDRQSVLLDLESPLVQLEA